MGSVSFLLSNRRKQQMINNIVKRRKTANYVQLNNFPIQEDLGDLQAIGLLTYIMSLPEDWILHKSQLQSTFTRRTVESAWGVLTQKNYAIGFSCYVSGIKGKQYFYNVSDIAFTQKDYDSFVLDVISELTKDEKMVSNDEGMKESIITLTTDLFTVRFVQYKMHSTKRTTTKEIKTKTHKTNKHSLTIDNLQEASKENEMISESSSEKASPEKLFTDACNEYYTEFAIGRWDKKTWNKVVKHFVTGVIENDRHNNVPAHKRKGYVYKALERIAKNHDHKKAVLTDYRETMNELFSDLVTPIEFPNTPTTNKTNKVPFYNWLEDRG